MPLQFDERDLSVKVHTNDFDFVLRDFCAELEVELVCVEDSSAEYEMEISFPGQEDRPNQFLYVRAIHIWDKNTAVLYFTDRPNFIRALNLRDEL